MKYRSLCAIRLHQALLATPATFTILMCAVVIGLFAGSACRGAASMSSPLPLPEKAITLQQFIGGIVGRSADLNYVTEQDSEVVAFYRGKPVKEMTDTVFLALLRRPSGAPITQQSWSTFFQIRTQNDPTGRWRQLQQYLELHLTSLTVFRLPRDSPYGAQYDLYAVGIFNGEMVVGVQMFGVAT